MTSNLDRHSASSQAERWIVHLHDLALDGCSGKRKQVILNRKLKAKKDPVFKNKPLSVGNPFCCDPDASEVTQALGGVTHGFGWGDTWGGVTHVATGGVRGVTPGWGDACGYRWHRHACICSKWLLVPGGDSWIWGSQSRSG